MPLESATESRHRLDVFSGHLATALRELHVTEQAGALSGVMAECCMAYLGPIERAFLLAVGAQAADPEDRAALLTALDPAPPCTVTKKEIALLDATKRWARAHTRWANERGEWRPPPEPRNFK